ncbi:hypothetical protein J6590_063504 [Homalodisca vitripennis]|nr:hypothetical protein J6590_063504 [Homalodisca vitripennis]
MDGQVNIERELGKSLEHCSGDLEQYSRRNTVDIFGVPESADENNLSLKKTVIEIGTALGVKLTEDGIDACRRISGGKNRPTSCIIVKFLRRDDPANLWPGARVGKIKVKRSDDKSSRVIVLKDEDDLNALVQTESAAKSRRDRNPLITGKERGEEYCWQFTGGYKHKLFSESGPLHSATVNYDKSGRSMGSAYVVFHRKADAVKAMKQYNSVPLDGRPMQIEITTSDVAVMKEQANRVREGFARRPSARRFGRKDGGRGFKRGGHGDERGDGRGTKNKIPTAAELDAELDAYISERNNVHHHRSLCARVEGENWFFSMRDVTAGMRAPSCLLVPATQLHFLHTLLGTRLSKFLC